MIDIKDVPDSLLQMIRQRFENDERVRKLRVRQNLLLRQGQLQHALAAGEEIELLFAEVVSNYLSDAAESQAEFDTETMDIPQEDKDRMMQLLMTLFMACDIIVSAVVDVNDVLHKTKKDLTITTFNDIKQASEMAREKLSYLHKNSNYMSDLTWGERCDDMYEMMQNKAKSIIRKQRDNKDWGKNTEKYQ